MTLKRAFTHGTIAVNADGFLDYKPDAGYAGTEGGKDGCPL